MEYLEVLVRSLMNGELSEWRDSAGNSGKPPASEQGWPFLSSMIAAKAAEGWRLVATHPQVRSPAGGSLDRLIFERPAAAGGKEQAA